MNKQNFHTSWQELLLKKHVHPGSLTASKDKRLQSHLEKCAPCRRKEQEILLKQKGLATLPTLTPSAGFEKKLFMELGIRPASVKPKKQYNFLFSGRLQFIAAALPLFLVSVLVFRGYVSPPSIARDQANSLSEKRISLVKEETPKTASRLSRNILYKVQQYVSDRKMDFSLIDMQVKISYKKQLIIKKVPVRTPKRPVISRKKSGERIIRKRGLFRARYKRRRRFSKRKMMDRMVVRKKSRPVIRPIIRKKSVDKKSYRYKSMGKRTVIKKDTLKRKRSINDMKGARNQIRIKKMDKEGDKKASKNKAANNKIEKKSSPKKNTFYLGNKKSNKKISVLNKQNRALNTIVRRNKQNIVKNAIRKNKVMDQRLNKLNKRKDMFSQRRIKTIEKRRDAKKKPVKKWQTLRYTKTVPKETAIQLYTTRSGKDSLLAYAGSLRNEVKQMLPKGTTIHFEFVSPPVSPATNKTAIPLLLVIWLFLEIISRILLITDIRRKSPEKKVYIGLSLVLGSLFLPFYAFLRSDS